MGFKMNKNDLELNPNTDTELKLTNQSNLDLIGKNENVGIQDPNNEYLQMETLALNAPLQFLAKYNSPKEWIMEGREASRARMAFGVGEPVDLSGREGIIGKAAYGVGNAAYETTRVVPELAEFGLALGVAIEKTFFPNVSQSTLDRIYNDVHEANSANRRERETIVSAYTGDSAITSWVEAFANAAQYMLPVLAVAKGTSTAVKTATAARNIPLSRLTSITGASVEKSVEKAVGKTIVGTSMAYGLGSTAQQNAEEYKQKTGTYDLSKYNPALDLSVNLITNTINAYIEKSLGFDALIPHLYGSKNALLKGFAENIAKGFLGEYSEEWFQEGVTQLGDMVRGYREWWDFDLSRMASNAIVGGVVGGSMGAGLYVLNRRAMIRKLEKSGMSSEIAADIVDSVLTDGIDKTMNNLSAQLELTVQKGEAYEKLKAGLKNALEIQGWSENIVDKDTGQVRNIDEYVEQIASDFIKPAIRFSLMSGLSIDNFLDVASFANINNVLYLRPLGTAEDIQKRIAEQDAIIARQRELKKTGAGNEKTLQEARMKRNILQNAYVQAKVRSEVAKAELEDAKTPEIKQEIKTANTDSEQLTKTETQADFDSKLDPNTTTAEKNKRFGNAVIKKIFGKDKFGFDSVMTLPEYTEARNGIISSANRIFEFAKKHRTYGIYTDLRNALNKMQTVNAGNFIDSITTPSLDGVDVVAENAFLYHFIFSDAPTISAYIDAYLERAEASISGTTQTSLSKKDLVGQAFKATDDLMQNQATATGVEYTSIYDSTGALVDKNVMAVLVSYQNQFVSDTTEETTIQEPTAEEQKEAVEQAADVTDGTITTGTPESVAENVIQDYGEKIEGAKKDLVGKGVSAETLTDIDKIMKKAPKSETSKQILRNWLEQQDPAFVAQIRQLNLPIRVYKTLEYRRVLEEAFTQHPELNQEADRYSVLAGNEELSKETLDKYGIVPEYDFYYKTTDNRYVKLTPENVGARIEGRGALQFSYSKSTRGTYFLWAKKGSGSWIPLIEFGSMEEMDEHRNSHTQEDREKIYQEMTSFKDNRKEKVIRERVGTDYRNGKNVTEEQFAKQFGFRGVQFGNYENQEKRQREINNSYDSFMDLAQILNLPPKAISLGGTLGIAFGARGSGTALAHYEPDLKVINITRNAGAGALAHEWFHALDNYLAQNLSQYANMAGGGFLTKADNYYYYRVNEELADSMKEYIKAIKGEKDFQLRLRQLGQYWKRDWEVAARLFEQYVSSKVAEQNGINDYLASPQKYYISSSPYLKLDEAERVFPKLENMLKSIKTREEDGNVILYQADIKNLFQPVKSQLNNFREKVRNVFQGKANKQSRITVVNETPMVYQALGFDKKPLSISYGVISKINKDKHNIPVAIVEDLPELVSDPVAVFKSKTDPENSVVAVLDAKDTGERTVVSIIRKTDGSYNVIPSVYGKDNFENFVANNVKDGNLIYLDENKVAAIRPFSLQLLGVYNDNLSNNNYITKSDVVNQNMQMLPQGRTVNGFYDPELAVIVLGRNMNEMTLPHEMAHYWLDTIFNIYNRVKSGELTVKEGWLQSTKEMFDMIGIDQNQTQLTKGQHEKFARMTEAYLTGFGIPTGANQTFKEYLKWIPAKYKSIAQLAYLDDQGKIQLPFLDQAAVDFFNRWYENVSLPSLESSPERERFMNVADDNGDTIQVSIKEMNDREKEFGQDAEEQERTDKRLYNVLDENMPSDVKPVADAQKVIIAERGNFLKDSEEQQRRWFEHKSRDTEAQLAQDYIEKNPEHAKEVVYGDPELVPNDTGVDRATLINAYMALNNITPKDEDWARLHTNIAINQSLAGTQLALSNDKSYKTYLDALREIESALELKAATNYAGSKRGAIERFNRDIQRFLDRELPSIFATEPNTKERETALRVMFEKARTTFSGNTTGGFLNQEDLNFAKSQKGNSEVFIRWAMNQIKKDAGAKLTNEQQAKLLDISAKAQQALIDIDNPDSAKAVAGAQELRKWQLEKQQMMGVSAKKFSLFGDYAPRAMLASVNTLFFANVPSTAMNTLATRLATRGVDGGIFGENNVSQNLIDKEVRRIKDVYGATGMNFAQMEKPTSPSLLHGEKYSASGQKWYDPYTILGKEDNFFRVPTFVNTLARIASTDAKATGRSADEVFKEYLQLNNQSDAAKLARKQALAVANMAVFTQDGALASCLNHIRSELNKVSRVMLGLDPQGFGLGNLLAPFLTTGANIAEMGVRGALAPVIQLTTWANQLRTGKAIDPMKKLALRMDWTYFTLSAVAMALLGALTSDDDEFYTDPYRTGIKYDPNKPYDSINIGGVWVDLDFFGAFAIPMRTAAMAIRQWKKDNNIGSAVIGGYTGSAKNVIGDVPLVESVVNNQFSWAVKQPETWAGSYAYTQLNKLVPAQIKPVSRAISRGYDLEYEGAWLGKSVGRKFHRNYGFDGAELTSQDLIEMLTIKAQLGKDAEQYLNNMLGL